MDSLQTGPPRTCKTLLLHRVDLPPPLLDAFTPLPRQMQCHGQRPLDPPASELECTEVRRRKRNSLRGALAPPRRGDGRHDRPSRPWSGDHQPARGPASAALEAFKHATARRCFICLGSGHLAKQCRDPVHCIRCRCFGHRERLCPSKRRHTSAHQAPCWRSLCPIRIDILQTHRITAVALHLGVF